MVLKIVDTLSSFSERIMFIRHFDVSKTIYVCFQLGFLRLTFSSKNCYSGNDVVNKFPRFNRVVSAVSSFIFFLDQNNTMIIALFLLCREVFSFN